MALHYRRLKPKGIPDCVAIIASQSFYGPRFADTIDVLGSAVLPLW